MTNVIGSATEGSVSRFQQVNSVNWATGVHFRSSSSEDGIRSCLYTRPVYPFGKDWTLPLSLRPRNAASMTGVVSAPASPPAAVAPSAACAAIPPPPPTLLLPPSSAAATALPRMPLPLGLKWYGVYNERLDVATCSGGGGGCRQTSAALSVSGVRFGEVRGGFTPVAARSIVWVWGLRFGVWSLGLG